MLSRAKSDTSTADFRRELGSRIRDIRKQKKLTLDQVAQNLSFTMQTLSKIENASLNPTMDSIVEIANALKVAPIFLIPGYDEVASSQYTPGLQNDEQQAVWNQIQNLDLRTTLMSLHELAKKR